MVRGHYDHNYDDNSKEAFRGRRVASAGISLLGCRDAAPRHPWLSTEGKIRLYSRHIRLVDECRFAQPAFAFCIFRRQKMTSRRTRPQNLATRGDFEPFRH